jgi:hypothetical protein
MEINIHPHARQRMTERCVEDDEVYATVSDGEIFPVKFGRTGFRRNFAFDKAFRGKHYYTKQVEVVAVKEGIDWIVVTVIAKFF